MSASPKNPYSPTVIDNKYDFLLIVDVHDGNPNGEKDSGNLPRIDPDTSQGLISDVRYKRDIRNYMQMTREGQAGLDIYIKEKAVLGRAHVEVFRKLGIATGEESRKSVPAEAAELLADTTLPEGVEFTPADGETAAELVVAADADKKAVLEWLKTEKPQQPVAELIKAALKDAKPRRPTGEETERGRQQMCADFWDIRTHGAVLTLKSAPNCGQVRGPVQLTFGRSVDPITPAEHTISRVAVATEAEAEKQFGQNHTLGRKNTVPYGLYVTRGSVSPYLARQTGFSTVDLELLWEAIQNMYEHSRSASRGFMAVRKLIVFKHASPLGNAPASALFDRVQIKRRDPTKPPRDYSDYSVTLDGKELPAEPVMIEVPVPTPKP
jgi:CRISPR-associated protein Csd2